MQLNRDKVALENQLEAEQEYITHRLQKQVAQLAGEKAGLQRERSELQRQVRVRLLARAFWLRARVIARSVPPCTPASSITPAYTVTST